ncbi:hypothetical protein [Paludisphaera rhizosphaerae]|uniref:hypothetical protein n=1 Tax=Paludisphaera rhizosphaerae TaxID=2711216 RepID=UPI00197F59BA|nr:hypothetical protein [Paludisphaera rhizosphaerae]
MGFTAVVVLVPQLLKEPLDSGASGERSASERKVAQAELLDFWASEGFIELAKEVAAAPHEPRWEDLLALMEARGCTELRYSLRVRWTLNDGLIDDITYMRRPYAEPWHAREFTSILRGGPRAAGLLPETQPRIIKLQPEEGLAVPDSILEDLVKHAEHLPDIASSTGPIFRDSDDRAFPKQ